MKYFISAYAGTADTRQINKIMELTPKVQINGQIRTDASGRVLERSTLLNIRTDDVLEAIQLFNQLRVKMNGTEKLDPVPSQKR